MDRSREIGDRGLGKAAGVDGVGAVAGVDSVGAVAGVDSVGAVAGVDGVGVGLGVHVGGASGVAIDQDWKSTEMYAIAHTDSIETPALVYYIDIIASNTGHIIEIAGGAGRLWPHVKTHKTRELVRMQMDLGIARFKCATIAEAEMLAMEGAQTILVAYPLVGPNIDRLLRLQLAFPRSRFWAVADDAVQLSALDAEVRGHSMPAVPVLIDVNMGMNRTGVAVGPGMKAVCDAALGLDGVEIRGFHCYDGHHNDGDLTIRQGRVSQKNAELFDFVDKLKIADPVFVMGGTPSFPCHAQYPGVFLSPGTAFVMDAGYGNSFPGLHLTPGAVVLTRVVSHPADGLFTLDLGYKGIASDPAGARGVIVGMQDVKPLFQSEEHWVFSKTGSSSVPPIGSVLYVVPTHICPTSALYRQVLVAQGGNVVGAWPVVARDRHLAY